MGATWTPPFALRARHIPDRCDAGRSRGERFTNAGVFISEIGAGQMLSPRAVALDPAGNLYVGEPQQISVFIADGTFQRTVGGLAQFQNLSGLTTSSGSNAQLFAVDAGDNSVQRIAFGGLTGGSFETGRLSGPSGVAVDSRDNGNLVTVFVADGNNRRVSVFGGGGPFEVAFGLGILNAPAGVAYSSTGDHVYVSDGTTVSAWKRIPDPVLGSSMDIEVDKETVLFKPPGANAFRKLTKVSLVKSGTIIDATRGTVSITSVTSKGNLQSADFYTGVFRAIQRTQGRGLTDAELFGGSFRRCPAGLRAARNAQTIRQLWGAGAGQFRTKGRYATATIRGTTWLTDDRCDGTLIRVTRGAVTVRDLVKKKSFVVRAGHRYFARAPR